MPRVSYYLTTPIYYVNARPHLGHAYTTIAADIAARHMRQRGEDVFFLTGTDEHGSKNARSAAEEGIDPKAYVDRISEVFRQLTRDVDATNDFFIRTSDEGHERFVQRFVDRFRDSGDVYEGVYAGLYCTSCEAFYREDELVEGLCPQHGTRPEWLEEKNWFFRLSAYQERLLAHYDANPAFVVPKIRWNEARAFIAGGLEDVSLSRASIEWGVPVPWDPAQTVYVWIDALINYCSALTYARPGEDLTARYWPARWQLMAKDILKFHAVIWPAMLLSAGYELPRQLLIHGYLTVREAKMSKSVGNVLDPFAVIERYGLDALRFYLFRDVRFGQDGDVSYARVHERYNQELANDLGNLVSRTVAMVGRYREGRVPAAATEPGIAATLAATAERFVAHLDRLELTDALEDVWAAVRELNRFVEERAPWAAAKDPARSDELDESLYTLCDGIRVLAVALASVMPGSARRMLEAVGAGDAIAWDEAAPGRLEAGAAIRAAGPLFPRVDEPLDA
jgi:methionyl-tRNA synthetase